MVTPRRADWRVSHAVFVDSTADGALSTVMSKSEHEFANLMADMHANNFLDEGVDAELSRSLADNLRGPQGKPGPVGAKGLTGTKVILTALTLPAR